MHWREGKVRQERGRAPGAVEYAVELTGPALGDEAPAAQSGTEVRALAYTDVVGEPQVGDRVLLNTTALARGLGTGGLAFVVALPDRLPPDPPTGPGHIVKGRYTPQQQMVLAVEEQESPYHDTLATAGDLHGMPIVAADLHSALPAIVAGIRRERPDASVGYVMTDTAALPAAFSRTLAGLRRAGWVAASVTAGQAYGGDLESVTVHSGLLALRHVADCDVAVVCQGPGNVGTGTRWGFSGVSAGEALNAAAVLGGRAVASLRVSEGDARGRHRGVSHHSLTAYGRVVLGAADVPLPLLPGRIGPVVRRQVEDMAASAQGDLRVVEVPVQGLIEALHESPVTLTTMGRSLDRDRAAFLAAAASGRWAAGLLALG